MAPPGPAPALSSPPSPSDLLFWGWRAPPILAHICGVRVGECLRRGVRPGLLADPAVLSRPHCPPPPSSLPRSTPSSCRNHPAWPNSSPSVPQLGGSGVQPFFPMTPPRPPQRVPDPLQADRGHPRNVSLLPHRSPRPEGVGKSSHKPCPHPSAPAVSSPGHSAPSLNAIPHRGWDLIFAQAKQLAAPPASGETKWKAERKGRGGGGSEGEEAGVRGPGPGSLGC